MALEPVLLDLTVVWNSWAEKKTWQIGLLWFR
jgi:hypothetical protein